jgi:type VI secretion system protein ImpM
MAGAVGVFGKLPVMGDFLDRGLPRDAVDRWHAWLVAGLASARAELGARFEPAYMAAPVWRFVAPGLGLTGVLLPSVDAVGRQFPLTLAAVLPADPDPLALVEAEGWFETLEDAGRAGLALDGAPAPWITAVTGLAGPRPARSAGPPPDGWQALDAAITGAAAALRRTLAGRAAGGRALLWSEGSPHVRAAAWIGDVLPTGAAFARLIADPVPAASAA